jgi:predicted Zn-dependent peptidase
MGNGLAVFLMEQHEVPLVRVELAFPAGSAKDSGSYGLASLTADVLWFGTKSRSKDQIEEALDFAGASYGSAVSPDAASFFLSFMAKDLERVFTIFQQVILEPRFDPDEFEKRKKRLLLELKKAKESPNEVIEAYFNKFLFENHPYGNPVAGTEASVAAVTIEDVRRFHASHYGPTGSAIAVVGDFDAESMKKRLLRAFGEWKKGAAPPETAETRIPAHTDRRLLLVNKDDATETQFIIGGFGIPRNHPDYLAIQVVNTLFGGRFTSWLNDELRVNRGLTYGAGSSFDTYRHSGTFVIGSYTRNEKTAEALDVALEVLNRLHDQGIDDEILASAKQYVKGQFPPRYERLASLASLLISMFVYGFDESFINDFQRNVDALTVEQANAIAVRYFPRDRLQFVLIGKASDIRETVKKYGRLTEKDIKEPGF